jgi:hypothetical protein
MNLVWILIIIFLLFGGGGGWWGYSRWGYRGGIGIVVFVLLVIALVYLLEGLRTP